MRGMMSSGFQLEVSGGEAGDVCSSSVASISHVSTRRKERKVQCISDSKGPVVSEQPPGWSINMKRTLCEKRRRVHFSFCWYESEGSCSREPISIMERVHPWHVALSHNTRRQQCGCGGAPGKASKQSFTPSLCQLPLHSVGHKVGH